MTQEKHSITSPDPHHDMYSRTIFGFWLFLLNDFVLFGTLFATFIVLGKNPYWAKLPLHLFHLDFATAQSFLMLFCAFFAGLGGASVHQKNRKNTLIFFGLTFFFAAIFMYFEILDFKRLIDAGFSWEKTALLSAFFSLIGTHGVHVLIGMLWIVVLLIPVIKEGIGHESIRRLTCLRMFFQFLNVVWIFIYTIVYFLGGGVA